MSFTTKEENMLVVKSTDDKIATIEEVQARPYRGAEFRRSYRLSVYDQDSILYHVSMHQYKDWALDELREICFEVKEMKEV